jgi:hypothetical protein
MGSGECTGSLDHGVVLSPSKCLWLGESIEQLDRKTDSEYGVYCTVNFASFHLCVERKVRHSDVHECTRGEY